MFVDIKAVHFSRPVFLGDSTRNRVRCTDHKIQYDEESQLVLMVHKKLGTQMLFREWCSIEFLSDDEREALEKNLKAEEAAKKKAAKK